MSLFRKYLSLSQHDRLLFLKAMGVSLVIKIVVFTLPMRWYSRYLNHSGKTINETNIEKEDMMKKITIAVRRCSYYAPWSTKCLVDAITAKLLLQWQGINSTLYLGVCKDSGKKLVAHAWLKCDEKFITGRKGYQKFTVVSRFS